MQNHQVASAVRRAYTKDQALTFDARTLDSTGAFLIGELERLEPRLHLPLAAVTWGRDITLRSDVTMGDEFSSFSNSTFAAAGGIAGSGKAFIGKDASALTGISVDLGKTATALTLWGMQIGWTIPELQSAIQLNRPIDAMKFDGMQLKYQMDVDEQVYIGDTGLGQFGLANSPLVTNNTNNLSGLTWAASTPNQILADVNECIRSNWAATGYSICPEELRVPPAQFALLVSAIVSSAGNISLLEFLKMNSLSNSINGKPLNIQPLKWLVGRGAAGKDRMVSYTNDPMRVRFPLVPLQRTPVEYRDLRQLTTYYGRLGALEVVYPETLSYRDGI